MAYILSTLVPGSPWVLSSVETQVSHDRGYCLHVVSAQVLRYFRPSLDDLHYLVQCARYVGSCHIVSGIMTREEVHTDAVFYDIVGVRLNCEHRRTNCIWQTAFKLV